MTGGMSVGQEYFQDEGDKISWWHQNLFVVQSWGPDLFGEGKKKKRKERLAIKN